jgi:hypothetical protein
MSAQDQADQLGSPGGVFLAEGLRLQDERLGGTGASGRPVIGRRGRLSAVILAEAEQVVDGAEWEAEALRQSARGQPTLMGSEKGLADGDRDSTRHGTKLLRCTSDGDPLTGL